MDRRQFLCGAGAAGMAGMAGMAFAQPASASMDAAEGYGVLVDTTECIGCRKCEYACAKSNKLSDMPLESFEDKSVFDGPRRMTANAYTVVNRHDDAAHPERPTFVKAQCMHCLKPACASACLVGALRPQPSGAVTYDPWKCMGCRYCMVACPFQVPAYEYDHPLTPKVSKCSFCFERVSEGGKAPACVDICPPMCLTFAKRSELVSLARTKIEAHPEKYLDHVYGEHELGGTSWLYLTSRPVTELGLMEFGEKPIPEYTEPLQHGIFKYGVPPALLFGLLAVATNMFDHKEGE
jgi:formate dehydrogenase iron-sulfur subunit